MTPNDQISQHLSYFSGPKTSGAENKIKIYFGNFFGLKFIFVFSLTNIVRGVTWGL